MGSYRSQSARDAARLYSPEYCEYLDEIAQEHFDKGYTDAFTRTLSEALMGNDGI